MYEDIAGFCKSADIGEIRRHSHILTPGRYVGVETVEDEGEPFPDKMQRLTTRLEEHFAESARLDQSIRENLRKLVYGK